MSTPVGAHAKAAALGKLIVRMTASAGSGHPSTALSIGHILAELLYRTMRFDPRDPWHASADRLVLSAGHAVPAVYAAWADLGGVVGRSRDEARVLLPADVDKLRERDSELDGHPNPAEGFPFFDAATGSLGMGLSVAAGLAAAARLDGSPRRVFAIIGDGESREGQVWEAADFIVDHRLTNVCAIINCNGHGQAAAVSDRQSAAVLEKKLAAFGWAVRSIDGHDPKQIQAALAEVGSGDAPLAIVARTVKGWGVSALLNGNWHGKPLGLGDVATAAASLDEAATKAGPDGPALPGPAAVSGPAVRSRPDPREARWPSFDEALRSAGLGAALDKRVLATRRAYGVALKVAGDLLPSVVCLDADVSNSTFADAFAKAHPARFFECKIGEQNMVSAAAGFAAAGYIPFANSFAKFIARAYDQVELASISRANIKLVGSHAGISLAADGPSQMAVADVAFFRSLGTARADDRRSPLCWVFQPSDAVSAYHCTRLMVETPGMAYMRTFRPEVPLLYDPATATFSLGGFQVLRTGEQLSIVAAGYMTHVALRAADLLAKQGVRATVIDAYCLPFDAEKLGEELSRRGGRVLVAEDNYGGGLGSAVAELAARNGRMRCEALTVQRMPRSTRTSEEILEYCGVGAEQVADQARALLARP
ncbi:MAG: transketolase [Phycisphaerales bacterium]|nr:transketolase [Phycisphaerales bacterium]